MKCDEYTASLRPVEPGYLARLFAFKKVIFCRLTGFQ